MNAITTINRERDRGAGHSPERELWQQVLLQAFIDAMRTDPYSSDNQRSISSADSWIRGRGRDFCMVCALAGMDPDFLHDAYVSGRVQRRNLKAAHLSHAGWVRT